MHIVLLYLRFIITNSNLADKKKSKNVWTQISCVCNLLHWKNMKINIYPTEKTESHIISKLKNLKSKIITKYISFAFDWIK